MKRFFPMILTFMLILTLAIAGCGGGNSGGNPGGNNPGGGNPGGDDPGGTTYTPGQSVTYTVGSDTSTASFNMHYAPSGSFPSDDDIICGCGLPSTGVVSNPYWIAETDVTYQLWTAVYTWATMTATDKYIFANAETRRNTTGNDLLPVDWVSWREAMVWCNALTECYNAKNGTSYACVYYMADHSTPIRSVNDDAISPTTQEDGHEDNPYVDPTAKGFRLPTSNEWELAARYQDGKNWTPGDHVSGDTSGYCCKSTPPVSSTASTVFQNYAWYNGNCSSTQTVGHNTPNALGLYDMSGNVAQWCFNLYPEQTDPGSVRITRGGGWIEGPVGIQIGFVGRKFSTFFYQGFGFRPVRTQ